MDRCLDTGFGRRVKVKVKSAHMKGMKGPMKNSEEGNHDFKQLKRIVGVASGPRCDGAPLLVSDHARAPTCEEWEQYQSFAVDLAVGLVIARPLRPLQSLPSPLFMDPSCPS